MKLNVESSSYMRGLPVKLHIFYMFLYDLTGVHMQETGRIINSIVESYLGGFSGLV